MLRLKRGDIIISKSKMDGLTYGKEYTITNICSWSMGVAKVGDISITDDGGKEWWFGQIGDDESWDNFFIDKKQWDRDKKINSVING